MKMKYKKFWILYDGKEIIEEAAGEYDVSFAGNTYSGMYSDGISNTDGKYIMIPFNDGITEYRKKLISCMINTELNSIENAKNRIRQLASKIYLIHEDIE